MVLLLYDRLQIIELFLIISYPLCELRIPSFLTEIHKLISDLLGLSFNILKALLIIIQKECHEPFRKILKMDCDNLFIGIKHNSADLSFEYFKLLFVLFLL